MQSLSHMFGGGDKEDDRVEGRGARESGKSIA